VTLGESITRARPPLTPDGVGSQNGAVNPIRATDFAGCLADLPATCPELELVVLFGSQVTGRASARSDVDLAVRCTGPADLDSIYAALAGRLRTSRLDLVDLRRAGPLLMFEVARTGRLLFEHQPGVFREFQSLASRRYADTRKLRDAQRRAIHVFLEKRGLA
jgi:predicted nucleotidyltransferase